MPLRIPGEAVIGMNKAIESNINKSNPSQHGLNTSSNTPPKEKSIYNLGRFLHVTRIFCPSVRPDIKISSVHNIVPEYCQISNCDNSPLDLNQLAIKLYLLSLSLWMAFLYEMEKERYKDSGS